MTDNPYEPSTISERPRRWAIRPYLFGLGWLCLLLSTGFALASVGMLAITFRNISQGGLTESPKDVASSIEFASFPFVAVIPLALLGISLLAASWIRRDSNHDSNSGH